jgi:hypothetical protein
MSILETATQNFSSRKVHSMEMPEWTKPGDVPLVVYFKTPNAVTIQQVEDAAKGSMTEKAARMVARVVQDADGNKLFQPLDYKELMVATDPNALARLYVAIASGAGIDAVQAEKN